MWRRMAVLGILAAVVMALAACSDSSPSEPTSTPEATFRPATPTTTATPDPELRIFGMRLLTPTDGWVQLATRLLWTDDGGQTWTDISLPPEVQDETFSAFFLDREHAWLSVTSPGSQGLESPSVTTVYRTSDGGETWHEGSFEGPGVPVGGAPPLFAGTVRFMDPLNGWFDGAHVTGTMSLPRLYRTTDGGETWVDASPSPEGGFGHFSSFLSSAEAWITVTGIGLFHTEDAGESWQVVQIPFPASCEEAGYFDAPTFSTALEGVVSIDQNCAALNGTAFYATTDGGESWEFAAYREGAYDVTVLAQDRWVDRRDDAVFMTTDGGRSWTDVSDSWLPVLAGSGGTAIDFADADHGWAIYGSQLFATGDGGVAWEMIWPE